MWIDHESVPTVPETYRTHPPTQLPPFWDPVIARMLRTSPQSLVAAVERYGSPLNVIWPHALHNNVGALRAVLAAHGVRSDIFYGAKVNKSQALVKAAVMAGAGIDVSSHYELRDALRASADPLRLCATGPAKTAAFHDQLLARGALVSVDSIEELDDLQACLRQQPPGRRARVLLRYRPSSARASRFGMDADTVAQCLRSVAAATDRLAIEGFHFHLGGYAWEARAQAFRELLPFVDAAASMGLPLKMIDIGGGLPVRYVDPEVCAEFLRSQRPEHYRNGTVPPSFYPYGGDLDAATWLDLFLNAPCVADQTIAAWLRKRAITLALEPGRSLADQAGITVFRVTRSKALGNGHHVVFVEGSSFSACETWFASEFLSDPAVVSAGALPAQGTPPTQAYIAGHSCLDEDVLTNRLLTFAALPRPGDLLVYANTAGYQMDLLENEFHRHPMPRRVVAQCNEAGHVCFSLDQ
ncbi:Y4yA family PLP-dependent enzyme [Cupriavidus sp. WKF15]|uniref:Y4yA family PLP-dependent enzyme n=1 Tax=Cupriavidus sp. WKF15 TaxID=3032282 RepID=UPI0023E2191A|nr:Y4yA family PLP-dependent enzyme [Cupriavidus sp. WKF15]WER47953.1 Y4yA family PLP-dependent enzyme [Cupriavidus sp. WKF15]